jgi:predicted nuclease of predicted toxin-antitoxin system
MRFLVDDQLPPALARWIGARGHESQHTSDIGLTGASDRKVWEHAMQSGAVVVTRDHDFLNLQMQVPGPKVVWITIGNCSKHLLLQRIEQSWDVLIAALEAGEELVELK